MLKDYKIILKRFITIKALKLKHDQILAYISCTYF
jgi:hypothetical protein